jgi:two-component system, NtrC family, sensor kinase
MDARAHLPQPGDELADRVNEAHLATLGMLVAGLAHEINTPLGALNSNHDVLRRALGKLQDILEDEVVEPHELVEVRRIVRAVDGILHVNDLAVERMTGLVRSLRDFGRLDRADVDFADLHEGLDSTLAILAHELRTLSVQREYGELPRVECRPQQINQVFMNLIMNARQATPDGGTITIRTAAVAGAVEVHITDTGIGIPPEQVARIFDPGFTTRGGRIGMGLGLAICRQIVDRHAGRLSVSSTPGAGAAFTLRLPLRHPDTGTPRTGTRTGTRTPSDAEADDGESTTSGS